METSGLSRMLKLFIAFGRSCFLKKRGELLFSNMPRSAAVPSRTKGEKGRATARTSSWIWVASMIVGVSVLHSGHLHVLFENDRYFSHLSSLEKELSFRTEMGLYFSYFKTVVVSPSFLEGVHRLLHDNRTEYPDTINTLQRFNLYPEVLLGGAFRVWRALLGVAGTTGKDCFQISRGFNQPTITACTGLGDHAHFYVWCVFALNGLLAGLIFALGMYLSEGFLGGFLAVCSFFFNHGEATRVMWTPPLRESFALPFLFLQTLAVARVIRKSSVCVWDMVYVCVATILFLLPWQFSQFVLVTQCLCILVLYVTRLLPHPHVSGLYWSVSVALLVNILLQFGNSLLVTSLLPCTVMACLVVVYLAPLLQILPSSVLRMVVEVGGVFLLMFGLKVILQRAVGGGDDAHIVAIFLSKFTSYKDFHTQLYTCSAEFDFLSLTYILEVSVTFLLPAAMLVVVVVMTEFVRYMRGCGIVSSHMLAEHMFQVLQTLAYLCLAVLIMRLKLFLTPQLCVLLALLAKPRFISRALTPRHLVGLLLVMSSFKGCYNLWQQWQIFGEFNSPEMEQLVLWANGLPRSEGVVFAGAMPTMATLRLTTHHSVVNHPHYEDAGLRRRTKEVYTIYSRKSMQEVHAALVSLGVSHVVVEQPWCVQQTKPGCSLPEVWDMEDHTHKGLPTFCDRVLHKNDLTQEHFKQVFQNSLYTVIQVNYL